MKMTNSLNVPDNVFVATMVVKRLLLILGMVLMCVSQSVGQHVCDNCNCQISSVTDSHAIYALALVCNTGTITWFGASGAVRLELTPFQPGNFRACFLADSENTQVIISQENSQTVTSSNYRLKVEGTSVLKLDHLLTSKEKTAEFCINSKNKEPLLLYIESVRSPGVEGVAKIVFHYDLEKLDNQAMLDPMEECRPCSTEEILDSYCSMDFVVIGSLSDVIHNDVTDRSNITLSVKQVIHQREPRVFRRVKRSDPHLTGHVTVPTKCGLRKSDGDFLLTGRVRLNSLILKCAIYLQEWRKIQHQVECSHA